MNENRLSFEPDDLQNNRATVLEQIYTLITSCRLLLLASAIFPPFPCSMQHSTPSVLFSFREDYRHTQQGPTTTRFVL